MVVRVWRIQAHCLRTPPSLYSICRSNAHQHHHRRRRKARARRTRIPAEKRSGSQCDRPGKNGVEALALIKEHSPDLVFLDVQMPGLDGFGVLKKLVERKIKMPHVVFATAFDQYAVQAFEVNAVDYVLKPFDKSRIAKAIQRARKMM